MDELLVELVAVPPGSKFQGEGVGHDAIVAPAGLAPMGADPDLAVGRPPSGMLASAMSLFTRVLLANAAVLAIVTLLLLFSPIEISYPVTNTQAVILVIGFLVSRGRQHAAAARGHRARCAG